MLNHCRSEAGFGSTALAVVSFLLVASTSPLHAADLPDEAKRALLDAKWQQALDALDDIKLVEADAPWRLVAAHGCLATNRNNKALLLLLTVKPEDAKVWSAWTEKLARANPANAVAAYLRADALARCGNMEEADRWFSRAITHDPKLGLARVGRGMVRVLAGRKDEAYRDFLEATDVQPDLAEAHASLGCAEVVLEENASAALDAFNEALRINPDFALAYNGRGCARYGRGRAKQMDMEKAAEDFRAAERLFPALAVTTTMNQAFLRAKVFAKVDQVLGGKAGPGTTIKTRIETLPSPPGQDGARLTDPEFSRPVGHAGLDARYDALSTERRELFEQLSRATSGVNREAGAAAKAARQIYHLEWAKHGVNVIITGATFGKNVAAQGVKTALKEVAPRVGKAALEAAVSPAAEKIPGASGRVVRTGLGGVSFSDGIDPAGLLFALAQERAGHLRDEHFGKSRQYLGEAVRISAKLREKDQVLAQYGVERIMRGDYDANSRRSTPDEQIRNALIVSNLPWRQMPKLSEHVQGMASKGGLVAIVGDTMMAHAVQRVLENKGVPTLSLPSLDKAKLDMLTRNVRPSAVVGFKPSDTDRYKVPLPPGGPGGGSVGIGSHAALNGEFPGDAPPYRGMIVPRDPMRDVVAYMSANDTDRYKVPLPPGGPGSGGVGIGSVPALNRKFPPNPPDSLMPIGPKSALSPKFPPNRPDGSLMPIPPDPPPPHGGGGGGGGFTGRFGRKFPPDPPGGGGGGGGGGFTGRSGPPRIDRIRSIYNPPGTWNWGQNWAPTGKAGGVDLNFDWVFVDKPDWPVATFFTLAYELPPAESAGPNTRN